MNIREALLQEHSKQQCEKIVRYIGSSQIRFNELVQLFLNDEYRVTQRAAWPLSYSAITHPELIRKHLRSLVKNLEIPGIHDAVKRNTVRMLQAIDIPTALQGEVMDICFRFVEDPNEKVAVKAFSLTVLYNLSRKHPDIIPEVKLLIEQQMPHQTAGFKSRAKKILKEMEK
ncbi:MAG: hypothetical protein KF746_03595 [Chitinophagaceae bacterium]|nr:hypothetical protein [Chitinophagaceae bacterium]